LVFRFKKIDPRKRGGWTFLLRFTTRGRGQNPYRFSLLLTFTNCGRSERGLGNIQQVSELNKEFRNMLK
jgi:hypothetical protein